MKTKYEEKKKKKAKFRSVTHVKIERCILEEGKKKVFRTGTNTFFKVFIATVVTFNRDGNLFLFIAK